MTASVRNALAVGPADLPVEYAQFSCELDEKDAYEAYGRMVAPKKHATGMFFTSTLCWPPFRTPTRIKNVGTAKAIPTFLVGVSGFAAF